VVAIWLAAQRYNPWSRFKLTSGHRPSRLLWCVVQNDVFVGVVSAEAVVVHFIRRDLIDRSPSVVLRAGSLSKSLNLDEFYGEGGSLSEWISKEALPLVGRLAPSNFAQYERTGMPMLMLFLDLSESHPPNPHGFIGGSSGKVSNDALLDEFRECAKEQRDRILHVYVDGNAHADQMVNLGLFGGAERLPGIAFNTKDGRQLPFSERLPINRDTLLQFCADFLSGRLHSRADAEATARLALTNPKLNRKNTAQRQPRKTSAPETTGVSEHFRSTDAEKYNLVTVNQSTFASIVLDDTKDVAVMFHRQGCEPCTHMAVYYKRAAGRLYDLGIRSLLVAHMDVTDSSPPGRMGLQLQSLPALVMFPAVSKEPPFHFYSGVTKVLELMKWLRAEASIPFDLPPLAHLRDDQKDEFKRQVAEREARRHRETKVGGGAVGSGAPVEAGAAQQHRQHPRGSDEL